MGDMADFALDGVHDFEESRLDFRLGKIDKGEAHDVGIVDELGYEILPSTGTPVKCRYCGRTGLSWKSMEDGRWRLFEGDDLHECQERLDYIKKEETSFAKCKFCEKDGLTWGKTEEGKWRLFDSGSPHVCDEHDRQRVGARCKFCEKDGLTWGKTEEGKWRLFEGEALHECEEHVGNRDESPGKKKSEYEDSPF